MRIAARRDVRVGLARVESTVCIVSGLRSLPGYRAGGWMWALEKIAAAGLP